MSEPKTALPTCLDCEFGGDFPCRDSEGNLEREKLIEAYRAVANEEDGGLAYDDSFWAFDCMETIVSEEPELALELIVFALTRFTRPDEISFLAAGPLENLVQLHGAQLIDRLERVAAINEQFRLLLSGIWGESSTDPEIWRRIQKAVADGPWIDQDPRTPQGSRKHSGEN
jgi:hypothetical protein